MIKIESSEVFGWEASIRGMRNPMNSWEKSDSFEFPPDDDGTPWIGPKDIKLMKSLSKAGPDHGKFLRMINVTCDITAPLYWWKEADTYKVGTVANSCSTMHKIQAKEFTIEDFSCEHLTRRSKESIEFLIDDLNHYRNLYLNGGEDCISDSDCKDYEPKDKIIWWQMIQLLPSSYNQKRTVQLNYQVLKSMYFARRNHKLDEWRNFCSWCEALPYFKEICIQEEGDSNV